MTTSDSEIFSLPKCVEEAFKFYFFTHSVFPRGHKIMQLMRNYHIHHLQYMSNINSENQSQVAGHTKKLHNIKLVYRPILFAITNMTGM